VVGDDKEREDIGPMREREVTGLGRVVEGNVYRLNRTLQISPNSADAVGPIITSCMVDAGIHALIEESWRDDSVGLVSAIYRAMWHRSKVSG